MPRFFIKETDVYSDNIIITGDDVNHIKKVLRLKISDIITLCDGKGNDYEVKLDEFESDSIHTKILSVKKNETEPPVEIVLYQGLPKSDKMDFIVQKSIELGVKKIVPVMTERTIVKIENEKDAGNKVSRWQRISVEAAKQCSRGIIPEIGNPVYFEKALDIAKSAHLGIIPYENETRTGLREYISKVDIKKVAVFIGPEGGFTDKEIKKAVDAGVYPVTLGPRILRTETAGIAVLSILMYELGDVG